MVVYETTAFQASPNRANEANAIINNANNALANSGLAHRYNLRYLHTAPLAFASGPATTAAQVKAAMESDPQIPQLRGDADLVVLVTEYLTKSGSAICGAAFPLPNEIPKDTNRDVAFRMTIDRGCISVSDPILITVSAHELGHLLHLEHQLTTAPEPDENATTPVTYNHPDILQQRATMMVGGPNACTPAPCTIENLHSDPQGTWPGTALPRGHVYDRNDKRMIDEAFPVIARYRPVTPPVTLLAPICTFCLGACVNFKLGYLPGWEHNTSAPIPPFAIFDVDRSENNGATWSDFFTGGQLRAPTTPPTQGRLIRARIISSYGNSPYCTIFLPFQACEDSP
jgi:hypothetical protein